MEDEEKAATAQEIYEGTRHGLKETKLHQEGKIELRSAKELLDEL